MVCLRDELKVVKPDVVFVHDDTTTYMIVTLAALYQQILVTHINVGLSTHNTYIPWSEEMNHQIISRIATYNITPTFHGKENHLKKGGDNDTITFTYGIRLHTNIFI